MGTPNFRFTNKDDPAYNPYGAVFTERQEQIIRGLPPTSVRRNELTILIRKAEKLGCPEIADQIYEMYEDFITEKNYKDRYTLKEAKKGLQALTPWKIKWD